MSSLVLCQMGGLQAFDYVFTCVVSDALSAGLRLCLHLCCIRCALWGGFARAPPYIIAMPPSPTTSAPSSSPTTGQSGQTSTSITHQLWKRWVLSLFADVKLVFSINGWLTIANATCNIFLKFARFSKTENQCLDTNILRLDESLLYQNFCIWFE